MSRISYPAIETATGAAAEVFAQVKKAAGSVPNASATIGSLAPDTLKTILNAEGVLASGTLSKQDRETIKLVVSEVAGCDYCVAAHSFLGKLAGIAPDTLSDIRNGTPTDSPFDSYAGPLTIANHLGNVAYRAGKKLEWDAETLQATNAPEASAFLSRKPREGWSLA